LWPYSNSFNYATSIKSAKESSEPCAGAPRNCRSVQNLGQSPGPHEYRKWSSPLESQNLRAGCVVWYFSASHSFKTSELSWFRPNGLLSGKWGVEDPAASCFLRTTASHAVSGLAWKGNHALRGRIGHVKPCCKCCNFDLLYSKSSRCIGMQHDVRGYTP
jgi:hypothetical protein